MRSYRPDDLEILEPATGAARAALHVLERFDGPDRARQHGRVPGERVRDSGEQIEPSGVGRGLTQDDECIPAEHLAVENPGAVEARRLDALDERHQVGHRGGAGHSPAHAYGCTRSSRTYQGELGSAPRVLVTSR